MNFEDTLIGRPNTIKTYLSLLKYHIKPIVLPEDCKKFNEYDVVSCVQYWTKKKLSPRTKQSLLRLLSKYVKFYGGPELNNIRILLKSTDRSVQQKEITVLSKNEAERLMASCKKTDPKFYPILLLALHAGLRRGEVFGLTCGDIDLFKNKIRIAHSYTGPTKNGKIRYVPMSSELTNEMIKARNLLMRPVDKRVFEIMNPNPHLHKICRQENLPEIRFHDLRHTFASLALENGVSPKQVALWLGHSTVHTTLSIYWHIATESTDVDSFLPGGNNEQIL